MKIVECLFSHIHKNNLKREQFCVFCWCPIVKMRNRENQTLRWTDILNCFVLFFFLLISAVHILDTRVFATVHFMQDLNSFISFTSHLIKSNLLICVTHCHHNLYHCFSHCSSFHFIVVTFLYLTYSIKYYFVSTISRKWSFAKLRCYYQQ